MIHVRQLKEDLQKERERHDNYIKSASEKIEKEREKVREACRDEVSGLVKQVNWHINLACMSNQAWASCYPDVGLYLQFFRRQLAHRASTSFLHSCRSIASCGA